MCLKFPTDNHDAKNILLDIKQLKEAKVRTVDKDELLSILNQAWAKYTLAKIKHK